MEFSEQDFSYSRCMRKDVDAGWLDLKAEALNIKISKKKIVKEKPEKPTVHQMVTRIKAEIKSKPNF
jgi:hypothetical protein